MSLHMDSCTYAYNLTDCLLQSVLDAVKDHNRWDVPTFSVTVLIGIVALSFAGMTVSQGIFGPGHRKCSKYAIGKWAKETKIHPNWAEFRIDSTAYTPVLISSVFQKILETLADTIPPRDTTSLLEPNTEIYGSTSNHKEGASLGLHSRFGSDNGFSRDRNGQAAPDRYMSATWLLLLKSIDMEDFVWDNFREMKQTAADYLPSEIQAIPAYMDVDTIIVLAAEDGCDRLEMEPKPESNCPLIAGTNIQVRFRQHPVLGLVASFERYRPKKPRETIESLNVRYMQLASNFESARGNFPTKTRFHNFNVLSSGTEPFLSELYEGISGPNTSGSMQNKGVSEEDSHDRNACPHIGKSELCGCRTLLDDLSKCYHFSWLIYAQPMNPKSIEVFPAKNANVEEILSTVVVQGSYWSRDHLFDQWILDKLNVTDWKSFWRDVGQGPQCDIYHHESWEVFALCLHFAVDVGAGKGSFLRLPRSRKRRLRRKITKEMQDIDNEILTLDKDRNSGCTRVKMYITSATLMRLEPYEKFIAKEINVLSYHSETGTEPKIGVSARNILRLLETTNKKEGQPLIHLYDLFVKLFHDCWPMEVDILLKSLFDVASRASLEEIQSAAQDDSPISFIKKNFPHEAIRELLIYRTVLLAVICLTALDSSAILDAGIGSQIVRFL